MEEEKNVLSVSEERVERRRSNEPPKVIFIARRRDATSNTMEVWHIVEEYNDAYKLALGGKERVLLKEQIGHANLVGEEEGYGYHPKMAVRAYRFGLRNAAKHHMALATELMNRADAPFEDKRPKRESAKVEPPAEENSVEGRSEAPGD